MGSPVTGQRQGRRWRSAAGVPRVLGPSGRGPAAVEGRAGRGLGLRGLAGGRRPTASTWPCAAKTSGRRRLWPVSTPTEGGFAGGGSCAAPKRPPAVCYPEITHNLLTLTGGTLYYNTNLGAVAALSADDGRLLWVSLYPRARRGDLTNLAPHWRRDLNPCHLRIAARCWLRRPIVRASLPSTPPPARPCGKRDGNGRRRRSCWARSAIG